MTAGKYARALLDTVIEDNVTEPVRADMKNIREILRDKKVRDYLSNRAVPKKDKMEAFSGCHPLTKSFLSMVMDSRREKELYDISREFMDLLNKKMNEAEAEVTSSIALTAAEKKELGGKLEEKFGRKVNITYRIDRKMIGGMLIKFDGNVMDGTVNGRLSEMRERLAV